MKIAIALIAFVLAVPAHAQPAKSAAPKPAQPPPSVSATLDRQLSIVEKDLVPLVKAMPADKFDFVPPGDGFKGSRSFKQQVGHLASAMEIFSATLLGEKAIVTQDEEKNGPARLKTKEDYVAFLEQAFAHGHKAALSVNDKNQLEMVGESFKGTRLGFANILTWHTFDHYGQLAVYARLNGVVPPASQGNN